MARIPNPARRQPPSGLEIRPAVAGDLGAVLELLSQLHDGETDTAPSEPVSDAFARILASPSRTLLVAASEGTLVGTLDLFVIDNLTHNAQPWAGIENLIVDSGWRRRGIGGALVEAALGIARETGCYKVQLVSHERRDAAHSLYAAMEFDAPVEGYRRYLSGVSRPSGG